MARPKSGYFIDGEPVAGTTTICGMLNKPALVGWAGRLCIDAAWDAAKNSKNKPNWRDVCYGARDSAAEAGTLVHDAFEKHLSGHEVSEFPPTDVGEKAKRGYENALHWLETSGLQIISHECPLVHRKLPYGGTPDAIAVTKDFGRTYLVDWKTSSSVYAEMIIQMGAYRELLKNGIPMNNEDADKKHLYDLGTEGVHLVRFSRETGDFAHYFFGDDLLDLGYELFILLLKASPLLKDIEKRLKH